jgi:hypothetical protein
MKPAAQRGRATMALPVPAWPAWPAAVSLRLFGRVFDGAADRRCARWLVLFLLCVYALTAAGRVISGDGEAMYQTTRALLTRGRLAIEARPESAPGRGGQYYSKYGLGQSAVQAPFVVAGQVAGKLFGARDDTPARFAAGLANSGVTAALALVVWLTLRELGCGRGAATAGTLITALATPLWPYARADFSEPLQATSLLAVFYCLLRYRRVPHATWAGLAGAAAGVAFLTKAATMVVLPPLALYFVFALWEQWRRRGREGGSAAVLVRLVRHVLAAGAPFVLCGALQAALNLYRFGSVTEFGYGDEPATGFTTPVLAGIHHLLISSGKGLFLFAPPVVLGLLSLPWLARRRPAEASAIALVFLCELLYFARWWAWHGDWCWGPRYMVVTIPFVMLGWAPILAGWRGVPVLARGLAGLLIVAGVAVSMLGVLVDYGAYYSVVGSQLGRGVDVQDARLVPEFSPILGHAWLVEASFYDTVTGANSAAHPEDAARNPFRDAYPWAGSHPELVPEAPGRAFGFDLWFASIAAKEDRSPFIRYWSTLVAIWLVLALIRTGGRLWRAARVAAAAPAPLHQPARPRALQSVLA